MDPSLDIGKLEEGSELVLKPRTQCQIQRMDFEEKYDVLEELGKGMFGVVKKCRNKTTGEQYAAKIVRKTTKSKKEVLREINMMNQLHHKRLAQIFDAFESSRQMIIIMEYIPGEELFEKIVHDDQLLTEHQVVRYLKQILFGVQHMHAKSIVHLDLKPENILCVRGGTPGYEEIKLIDFGLAREIKQGASETCICGTPEFVAPEVISFDPVSIASDMWSLGVITYILLSGVSPFLGDDDNETLQNVTSGEFDFDDEDCVFENVSNKAKEFIEKLILLNPRKRMSVEDCLKHDWLMNNDDVEHVLDTSKLKKYLARRKWKKTINAIKAVGRFSLGLSMLRESVKNKRKENEEMNSQKIEQVTQPEVATSEKKDDAQNSSDEGICDASSDGDISEEQVTTERIMTAADSVDDGFNESENDGDKNNNEVEEKCIPTITEINEPSESHMISAKNLKNKTEISNTNLPNNDKQSNEFRNFPKEQSTVTERTSTKKDQALSSSKIMPDSTTEHVQPTQDDVVFISREERQVRRNSRAEERRKSIEASRKDSSSNGETQDQKIFKSSLEKHEECKTIEKSTTVDENNNNNEMENNNHAVLKKQVSFHSKFNPTLPSSTNSPIQSPSVLRRISQVKPSQIKQQGEDNSYFKRGQVTRKSYNGRRSVSNLCKEQIDENGNYVANRTPVLRRKSVSVNVKLSNSVKDRMAMFQRK